MDHFINGRSLIWVRVPTLLNESPHFYSKTELLGSPWPGRSLPIDDMGNDRPALCIAKRDLPGENFHHKHGKRKHVSGLGCYHKIGTGAVRWINDFWGEPSEGVRGHSNYEARVRGDGAEAIITDLRLSICGYQDIGLMPSAWRGLGEARHPPLSDRHG